jgi:hypothetical protein
VQPLSTGRLPRADDSDARIRLGVRDDDQTLFHGKSDCDESFLVVWMIGICNRHREWITEGGRGFLELNSVLSTFAAAFRGSHLNRMAGA